MIRICDIFEGKENHRGKCANSYSSLDNRWITHSLHTDQIGTGCSFLDAFTDLLVGISNLLKLANRKKDIKLRSKFLLGVETKELFHT